MFFVFLYMTIFYALLVLLVAVLVTRIKSLYDLTIYIHLGRENVFDAT